MHFLKGHKAYTSLRFEVYSFRRYGEPKLTKPKKLKGIKQIMSIDYVSKKCRCPIFILDSDVWIRHNDYFSEPMRLSLEDMGMPLGHVAKKHMDKHLYVTIQDILQAKGMAR